jgi:hypothetical protein
MEELKSHENEGYLDHFFLQINLSRLCLPLLCLRDQHEKFHPQLEVHGFLGFYISRLKKSVNFSLVRPVATTADVRFSVSTVVVR